MKSLWIALTATAVILLGVACNRTRPPAAAVSLHNWVSYEQALAEAKASKKLLLLDFTGSDWCPLCIKLEREVFSQARFTEYARDNVVLLEVDFPRGREQSAPERKQNYDLQERFDIQGYPTVIVLDGNGRMLGQLGYEAGIPADATELIANPETFIARIEKLRQG